MEDLNKLTEEQKEKLKVLEAKIVKLLNGRIVKDLNEDEQKTFLELHGERFAIRMGKVIKKLSEE